MELQSPTRTDTGLLNDFLCPNCKGALTINKTSLACPSCTSNFKIDNGIPVFTKENEYWCNIDQKKMHQLIHDARQTNNWKQAVHDHLGKYQGALVPFNRADAQFYFPINKDSVILDAGCMWGGLTIPISQYCKKIFALDKTLETVELLSIRAQQEGRENIVPVVSPIQTLPFPDNFFDFVILNGVLEWLAFEEHVILENHWSGKYKTTSKASASPEAIQLNGLQELYRVIKPTGGIYIAIENRSGLPYFLGHPDDHMNIRFVPFLPRRVANFATKIIRKTDYKTYIYTPRQLKNLITRAGFKKVNLFSIYPHYQHILRMCSMSNFKISHKVMTTPPQTRGKLPVAGVWKLLPIQLSRYMSPSLGAIAMKSNITLPPRLLSIIKYNSNVLKSPIEDYEMIIASNRTGDSNPICFHIVNNHDSNEKFFCKVERQKQSTSLKNEAINLKAVIQLTQSTPISNSIPAYIAYIKDETGIQCLITSFVEGDVIKSDSYNFIKKAAKYTQKNNTHLIIKTCINSALLLSRFLLKNKLKRHMPQALLWLYSFQVQTKSSALTIDTIKNLYSSYFETALNKKLIDNESFLYFQKIQKKLESIAIPSGIFLCAQHGDFDICNILFSKKGISIVDFEHFENKMAPFFDVGNLIFSPVLQDWRCSPGNRSFAIFLKKSGWLRIIKSWIQFYFDKAGIPSHMLEIFISFVTLEQNAKKYPDHRDPYSYPMYGKNSIIEMRTLTQCLLDL